MLPTGGVSMLGAGEAYGLISCDGKVYTLVTGGEYSQ